MLSSGRTALSLVPRVLRFPLGQVTRPIVHQDTPPLKQVRAGIGRFDLVPDNVRQRRLHDRMRRVRAFSRPTIEAGTKSMGYGSDAQLLEQVGQCRGRKRLSPGIRKHQTGAPVLARVRSKISSVRLDNGTRCSRAIFILSAGIVQRRSTGSISFHRARRTSPERAAVNTRNPKASFEVSDAFDSHTVRIASATSS